MKLVLNFKILKKLLILRKNHYCIMRSFITCTLRQVNDQVKEDEMGRACSKNGGEAEGI
jgi:type IV secretory pathway protease TraF